MEKESIWWLIDIIILLMVLSFIFSYIGEVGEQTSFQKRFLANDLALMVDTLYASPGNIYINYPQNTLWFGVSFTTNQVEVFEKEKDSPNLKETAYFLEDKNVDFVYESFIPKERYKEKKSFFKKYFPIFDLMNRFKHDITINQTLNLTFFKSDKDIKMSDGGPLPILTQIRCDTDPELDDSEFIFLKGSGDNDFFQSNLYVFNELGKVIGGEELSDEVEANSIIFTVIFKENQESDYIKSYFDAELSNELLSPISCNLVNEILSTGFGEAAYAASIPSNKITLNEKVELGFSQYKNIMLLEMGNNGSFKDEDYQNIRKSIYSTLFNS